MNILSIAVACVLVYYLYQGSRPLKRQKGGNKGVVIVLVVLLLAGGGVAAYFLLKDDSSPSPSPTPSPVGNSGSTQSTSPSPSPPQYTCTSPGAIVGTDMTQPPDGVFSATDLHPTTQAECQRRCDGKTGCKSYDYYTGTGNASGGAGNKCRLSTAVALRTNVPSPGSGMLGCFRNN